MDVDGHIIAHFVVLFTAQKLKKFKTWQDGTMKYYSFNRKLVLTDEKGYNIDKKFNRTGVPNVGDEIEFDGHLVTVESFECQEPYGNEVITRPSTVAAPLPMQQPITSLPSTASPSQHSTAITQIESDHADDYRTARKRLRSIANRSSHVPTRIQPSIPSSNRATTSVHHVPHGQPSVYAASAMPITQHAALQQATAATNPSGSSSNGTEFMHILALNAAATDRQTPNYDIYRTIPSRNGSVINAHAQEQNAASSIRNPTADTSAHSTAALPQSSLRARSCNRIRKRTIQSKELDAIDVDPVDFNVPDLDSHMDELEGSAPSTTQQPSFTSPLRIPNNATPTTTPILKQNTPSPRRLRVGISKRSLSNTASEPPVNAINIRGNSIPSFDGAARASFVSAATVIMEDQQSQKQMPAPGAPTPSGSSKPFKSPIAEGAPIPLVLQFPARDKIQTIIKTKKHPKRTRTVPSRIPNVNQYKDVFRRIIHEHLQVMLTSYAVYFYSVHSTVTRQQGDLERPFRSKGIGFYSSSTLHSSGRFQASTSFRIRIRSREHHSKYSRDDLWVVSRSPTFEPHTTFLARSTFYGPFADGMVEIECLSQRDARVASTLSNENSTICALRTISSTTEFMTLDHLDDKLDRLPLMPYMLGDGKKNRRKGKEGSHRFPEPDLIKIRRDDNVNVEQKLKDTIDQYHLNEDQANVLRQVAKSIIVAPGWNEEADNPIVLVHGVFGSGKSYLAAVIIIFLRDIVDTACTHREPDDLIRFRILISSMTNVAVDRILSSLLKLGYDDFVRIGSLKKIAKPILPYTAKAKTSGNEELKELEQMLEDPQNSEEDMDYIASTLQRFRKTENSVQVNMADVVGTTCIASAFDVFNGATFSLALLDEASQLTEPLSMVPLARFSCSRLIMIGDPLQLPPTVTTSCDEQNVGEGIDKTLFDRLTEMSHQSILLRTQYRCHPSISAISNHLFYQRRLQNGVTAADRSPVLPGLPNLAFVEVNGKEQRNPRTQSFWNETEVAIAAHITETLLSVGISASDIGVISLYKEQADRLAAQVGANAYSRKSQVQISTVDAFQGGEKEVIILSTVRTTSSVFIDNRPRVNVALTRARRHLIILGNQSLLLANDTWSHILTQCQESSFTSQDFGRLLSQLQLNQEL